MSLEVFIRATVFIAALAGFSVLERFRPLRLALPDRKKRAFNNLVLMALSAILVRLLGPLSAVGAAFLAQSHGIGLAHWLELRLVMAFVLSLVLLDLALYVQHLMMHAWTPLWRLHRVHHSDTDLDTTTGVRFHPGEILVSLAYKSLIVILLGAPPVAVVTFEVILNVSSLFNHSNLALPPRLESWLRVVVVTPAMHWVHHSQVILESQRNFGFCLSFWDRLFKTYLDAPAGGIAAMHLGVLGLGGESRGLWRLLRQPLLSDGVAAADYRLGSVVKPER